MAHVHVSHFKWPCSFSMCCIPLGYVVQYAYVLHKWCIVYPQAFYSIHRHSHTCVHEHKHIIHLQRVCMHMYVIICSACVCVCCMCVTGLRYCVCFHLNLSLAHSRSLCVLGSAYVSGCLRNISIRSIIRYSFEIHEFSTGLHTHMHTWTCVCVRMLCIH